MYARNGDRKVPAGITIPENYGGSTFVPRPPEPATDECTCKPPFPADTCRCERENEKCENTQTCGCNDDSCVRPEPRTDRDGHGKCGNDENDRHGGGESFMNISIGAEELLLIGVMALIFFSGDARDNELLICLLLVLLI